MGSKPFSRGGWRCARSLVPRASCSECSKAGRTPSHCKRGTSRPAAEVEDRRPGHWAAALATVRGVRFSRIRRNIAALGLLTGPGTNLVLLLTMWSLHPPRCFRPTAVPVHTTAALANPHTEILSGHGENVMRVNLTVRASHRSGKEIARKLPVKAEGLVSHLAISQQSARHQGRWRAEHKIRSCRSSFGSPGRQNAPAKGNEKPGVFYGFRALASANLVNQHRAKQVVD